MYYSPQADVAVLVVDATTGEFESGFESGGQTREHALLARSLGVRQLVVAVNKMDTTDWSETRFDEIVKKLKSFLKQAGFRVSTYIILENTTVCTYVIMYVETSFNGHPP